MTQQLSYYQKRQAAELYYFTSLDYLKGLKERVDALIELIDPAIERAERIGVDRVLTNERWGVRDTVANWTTGAWPFLKTFQEDVVKDIAARAHQRYDITGASQCSRGLSEFSMMWATPEQEAEFKQRFDDVYKYAIKIDSCIDRPCSNLKEVNFATGWNSIAHLFPRLPKFVVHEDIAGFSGEVPRKTGVYVPQNEFFGVCQFGWTGSWMSSRKEGYLDDANLLNELGRDAARAIGHKYLWTSDPRLVDFLKSSKYESDYLKAVNERRKRKPEATIDDPFEALVFVSKYGTESKRVDWYYVELIEGEYDDDPDGDPTVGVQTSTDRNRVEAGKSCPRDGWWLTPAKINSRRYLKAGEVMPDFGSDYGNTIWQWDADQTVPKI